MGQSTWEGQDGRARLRQAARGTGGDPDGAALEEAHPLLHRRRHRQDGTQVQAGDQPHAGRGGVQVRASGNPQLLELWLQLHILNSVLVSPKQPSGWLSYPAVAGLGPASVDITSSKVNL